MYSGVEAAFGGGGWGGEKRRRVGKRGEGKGISEGRGEEACRREVKNTCHTDKQLYLDFSIRNGVFTQTRPVKGHPVLVMVQIHSLYPASVEPTLTLGVKSCCVQRGIESCISDHNQGFTQDFELGGTSTVKGMPPTRGSGGVLLRKCLKN